MTLFEECLEALGKDAKICNKSVDEEVRDNFDKNFQLLWSRINWDLVKEKYVVFSIKEIFSILRKKNKDSFQLMYVIGNNARLPIFESKLDKVLEFFDDVVAVS